MLQTKKIRIGRKNIAAYCMPLGKKKLIILKGRRGYVMCGYLNLKAADSFKDTAVLIKGVSTIKQALSSNVYSASRKAKSLGIKEGQDIKSVLKIIS
ncbi:MAG: DUF1805 domain-containing protein [Candidatus Omnitrophica bacterium]|nr:DUF1805 domain-containing protein [Candidatus Omnitrophota bacterium]MDD5430560.1 DUF1805 domain-containing protein [Candidatus Omnitrophota bacterium]